MKAKLLCSRNLGLFFGLCLFAQLGFAQGVKLKKYSFGEGLNFVGDQGYSMELTGYIQPYLDATFFTDTNYPGAASRFRMRRARLRFAGKDENTRLSWRLQVDLSGTAEIEAGSAQFLMDAWLGYNLTKRWIIRVGQKNTPTDNRELQIASQSLQLVERSKVTSAFSTIREFGIFLDGTVRLPKGMYLKPSLVLSNGDGLNVFGPDFGGFKYGGRLDFLPFGLFTNLGQFREVDIMRELVPRLVLGVAYSKNNGMSSRRGRESGTILYLNDLGEYSLPDFTKIGVDFLFKYRGFSALGEFVLTTATVPNDITQRVRVDGSVTNTFLVNGVEDVENYVKGRMMLGKGYNFQMGYLFKNRFSIDARYTHLAADENSFLNNGTFFNRPNYYTFGISQYFSKMYGAKIQASIDFVDPNPGSNYFDSTPKEGDEWVFRLITSFAF